MATTLTPPSVAAVDGAAPPLPPTPTVMYNTSGKAQAGNIILH